MNGENFDAARPGYADAEIVGGITERSSASSRVFTSGASLTLRFTHGAIDQQ